MTTNISYLIFRKFPIFFAVIFLSFIFVDFSLSEPIDADMVLRSESTESLFGYSVASAGDYNGDEINDLIVGAYNDSGSGINAGKAFVFLGRNSDEALTLNPETDADIIFNGESNSFFGFSVSSAGDFNGDGFDDVIVGAPFADRNSETNSGAAYIFFGGPGFTIGSQTELNASSDANVILEGQSAGDQFGFSVASAGDFQGDEDDIQDVIVGAPEDDNNDQVDSGSVFVFFGQDPDSQILLRADASADIRIDGQGSSGNDFVRFDDEFGWSVASAGDFNNDDINDVIIGAPGDDNSGDEGSNVFDDSGAAFIFFGGIPAGNYKADDDANVIINSTDFQDNLGFSVAGVGDFNGDGFDDAIVGAPFDDNNNENMSGSAFIFFGSNIVSQTTYTADTDANIILNGQSEGDRLGWSVASAGDFNGDGLNDAIVGAPKDDNNSEIGSGSAFIFFGENPGMQISLRADSDADLILDGVNGNGTPTEQGDEFGISVFSAGDFFGSGTPTVIIGSWLADSNDLDNNAGTAYLLQGLNVAFNQSTSDTLESAGSHTVNVSLSIPNPFPSNITVDFSVNGSGTTAIGGGTDYLLNAGTLTFPQGVQTQGITFPINNDNLDSDDANESELETIEIILSNPVNAGLGIIDSHNYTIIDNDGDDTTAMGNISATSPTVYMNTTSSSGFEFVTSVNVEVKLSNAVSNQVGVEFEIAGGTAIEGTDYNLVTTSPLVFNPGQTSQNITLQIINESILENDETIEIDLSESPVNASTGIRSSHVYTILAGDNSFVPSIGFDITNDSITESDSNPQIAVSLSSETGKKVTVEYHLVNQSQGGNSFSINTGMLTFEPGTTSQNISATVVDDDKFEGEESVLLSLYHPKNATLGESSHVFSITDNDTAPTVAFDSSESEGDEGDTTIELAVSLSAESGLTATVDYDVTGGTAEGSGADFTLESGTLTFEPDTITQNISLTINDDGLNEAMETLVVTLSNPDNATLGTNTSHTFSITDNDSAPTVEFDSTSSQGDETVSAMDIPVSLSEVSGQTATVDFEVSGGTAVANGEDFTLDSGTLTFEAGNTTKNISVTIASDLIDEPNETIEITLSNPSNIDLGTNTIHIYTINDDDDAPKVAFDSSASEEMETVTPAKIPVSLTGPSGFTVSVDYEITGGTASPGLDFVLNSGTLSFDPGTQTQEISVILRDDDFTDLDETLILTLSNPSNSIIDTNNTHTLTIIDNDLQVPVKILEVVSPYWQLDSASYTFIGISHPSLSRMSSRIGVRVKVRLKSGELLQQPLEFTIRSNQTQRLFIVQSNHPFLNPVTLPNALFLLGDSTASKSGNLKFQSLASNPDQPLNGTLISGHADISMLNFWGAVVVQATSTGFAMEFVGDNKDSRAFNTLNFSGIN